MEIIGYVVISMLIIMVDYGLRHMIIGQEIITEDGSIEIGFIKVYILIDKTIFNRNI